jgi:hypothetical protein
MWPFLVIGVHLFDQLVGFLLDCASFFIGCRLCQASFWFSLPNYRAQRVFDGGKVRLPSRMRRAYPAMFRIGIMIVEEDGSFCSMLPVQCRTTIRRLSARYD